MARWRKRLQAAIPAWVMDAWVTGCEPEVESVNDWLEDLRDQDPARWEVVLVELLSTPGYTQEA